MSDFFNKIIVSFLITIMFLTMSSNVIKAAFEMSEAYIEKIGEAPYHLKYYKEEKGIYTYSTCSIVGYKKDGKFYPAYCLNRDLHGVGAVDNYSVDVDSLLDNNEIWRAVKNGYPYKSASEMGLESDFDAFAVTKFAIYCLTGQADINLYTADEQDQEGQAMLNALHNLVDIGKNGRGSFKEELKLTKAGEFIEDGDYYSCLYSVTSNSTISSYNITKVSGLADGDIITDTNGNIKTKFLSGEKFKVKISKSNLNSNKDINIEVEGNLKSYPMFYGKTRIAGTQNYLLTASSYKNISASENLNLKLNTGKIEINKIDDETKQGIEGVTFELYNSKNELLKTETTDKNGKIEFGELFQGKYLLKETNTNENYILEENSNFDIDVNYNKTSKIDIENEHKKGNLEVYKVDKDNNNIVLGNVEFELYRKEDSKIIGTYYTDANGKIEIKDLRTGEYLLKEISTNDWYNLAEPQEIYVNWNETTSKTVEDELKKGKIKIIKVDKDNKEVKIPNVVFEVLDVNNNLLEKIKTNEQGEAETKSYAIRDFNKLRLHEIETDEKYELNNEIKELTLEENQIKDVIFENEKIKGKIKVVKTTEEKSELSGLEKGVPLPNVKFEIYDEFGNKVDSLITDNEGIALSKDLEKGKYKLKEVETNEWYFLDDAYHNFEIQNNKQLITLKLTNKPKTPDEKIEKTGPNEAQAGEKIEYTINIENTGNVSLGNFVWEDEIPVDYIKVNKIELGQYNQENTYSVYYKTNFSKDYILLLEDISTTKSEEIDLSKELSDNEYITNIKLDFGTVEAGFKSQEETKIYAKVNNDARRDEIFENKVTLNGKYKDYNITRESKWKTKIYKILPKTGM